ncbi:protein of unknown function [Thermosyntropha lipolytica DSM 11003]|uniref:SipL SPOCS domain-containing protein n=1 Tax=Thermosyntropha lipolytica DSM 11003 TaxID=1123382 RepID=A0A1M5NFG1_9FIRM|nr:DUF3794 domain-containing protein [Thermosyntropha lipolytica]SHG88251.1 protein of unknown function [Thermosyntropha lipolytica DSM 11003]
MPVKIDYSGDKLSFPKPEQILASNQFIVEKCIEIPRDKPDMARIVDVKPGVKIDVYQLIDSPRGKKVFIRGHIEQEILYIADMPCQPVHGFHAVYSFGTFIDLHDCGIVDFSGLESLKPQILIEFMETVKSCSRSISQCIILFAWCPRGSIIPPKPHPPCPYPPCFPTINIVQECKNECRPKIVKSRSRPKYYVYK